MLVFSPDVVNTLIYSEQETRKQGNYHIGFLKKFTFICMPIKSSFCNVAHVYKFECYVNMHISVMLACIQYFFSAKHQFPRALAPFVMKMTPWVQLPKHCQIGKKGIIIFLSSLG